MDAPSPQKGTHDRERRQAGSGPDGPAPSADRQGASASRGVGAETQARLRNRA
jgi:hypothetical protein